ncbi:hypothetical protein [Sphingobium indicum]|uniref:hypothetical protein n=1 Tax=Sphingobium indicum TaxID=332055 RepID=UPI0005627FFD|nr:hypothetical protein [Sphingobium indicum]
MDKDDNWGLSKPTFKIASAIASVIILPVIVGSLYWIISNDPPALRYMAVIRIAIIATLPGIVLVGMIVGKFAIEQHRRF